MKTQKNTAFQISTLSAALMVVYGTPAFAADDNVAELINPKSSVSVGVGAQNHDRDQLGMFDGRKESGGTLLLDADINKRENATGTWTKLKVRNFGLDNRELEGSYGKQGDYNFSYEYSRITREAPYTVNTSLQGIGTSTQILSGVVPGAGTTNLNLETHRNRSTLGFDKRFSDSFDLTVKYRNEEKKGLRHFGTNAVGTSNPNFFVEPIDSRTHQLDIRLNYLAKELQLQGGYYGSWYKNKYSILSATGGANTYYMSLPPDNMAHQIYLNGSYTFSPTTKITARLSHTTGTQDDQRMRTGVPATEVLAGWGGVKAKVVTSEAQLGISTKPIKNLSLLANVYLNDRKDKTPDVAYNAAGDRTTPHSFRKLNAKFEAAYRMESGLKLLGGAYLDIRNRSTPSSAANTNPGVPSNAGGNWTFPATVAANLIEVPYRDKTKELTLKGQATKNLTGELNGSLTLAHSKRNGSDFKWGIRQNLANPLHMADRERDKLGVKLDWSPSQAVSIQAQFDQAKDDYGTNGLHGDYTAPNGNTLYGTGIRDGRATLFSADASFKLNDEWKLTAWYSRDESKATLYVNQNNFGPEPTRKANLADIGDSFGIGVKGEATAKLTMGADLEWNQSVGKFGQSNFNNQGNMVEDLPNITNKSLRIALNGIFQLDKKSAVRVDFIHERWDTNDWSWMMWNNAQTALVPYSYVNGGDTVTTRNNQSSNSIYVRYKYDF